MAKPVSCTRSGQTIKRAMAYGTAYCGFGEADPQNLFVVTWGPAHVTCS